MDKKYIGEKLRELRGNVSREDVAKLLGISLSALSMYENGERIPRDEVKIRLSKLYGKSVEEIFFTSKVHEKCT